MSPRNVQADPGVAPLHPPTRFRSLDDPETLRMLVRNLGEGIYISTAEGKILDANEAFVKMVGYPSLEELKKQPVQELYVSPEKREQWKGQLGEDGRVKEFEFDLKRVDGQVITVLDTAYALRDEMTGEVFYHGILVDINARKATERQLFEASIRDPLTGCYNRRYLSELERDLDRRPYETWACIYIDLDGFKQFNDTYGHSAGDAALVNVSRFLLRQLRAEDLIFRVGGDEFLAVLRGVTGDQSAQVVRRLEASAAGAGTVAFTLGWAQRDEDEPFSRTVERADQRLLVVRGGERAVARRVDDKRT